MQFIPKGINYLSTSAAAQAGLQAGTWYNNYTQVLSLAGVNQLGTEWVLTGPPQDGGGMRFACVRTTVNLAAGQVVAMAAPTTGTVTAAGSTVAVINTNVTASAANVFVDGYVYFEALGLSKRIKANTTGANCSLTIEVPNVEIAGGTVSTATPPFGPDALTAAELAALTNGSALSIVMPYDVRVATNALYAVGVAIAAVTAASGPYTIIQRGGYGLVLADATTPGLVTGVPAQLSATAGSIEGTGGTANAYTGTSIVALHTYNTSAALLVPCQLNF